MFEPFGRWWPDLKPIPCAVEAVWSPRRRIEKITLASKINYGYAARFLFFLTVQPSTRHLRDSIIQDLIQAHHHHQQIIALSVY